MTLVEYNGKFQEGRGHLPLILLAFAIIFTKNKTAEKIADIN